MNLNNIIKSIKDTNLKINNDLDKILNLNLSVNREDIDLMGEISHKFKDLENNVNTLYLSLLSNDEDKIKSTEEENEIKNIKIDNHIKKIFLPYMILMRIYLENQN